MNWAHLTSALKLGEGAQRALIVEDDLSFLARLSAVLLSEGHEVTRAVGVTTDASGDLFLVFEQAEPRPLTLKDFDIFFLDHYFASKSLNGELLTRRIRNAGQQSIMAMSSDSGANERMLRAGANFALRKADFRRLLPDSGL